MIYIFYLFEIIATYIEVFTCIDLLMLFYDCKWQGIRKAVILSFILAFICVIANEFRLFSPCITLMMVILIALAGKIVSKSNLIDCLCVSSSYMMCIYIFDFMSLSLIGFIRNNVNFAGIAVDGYSIERCLFLVCSKIELIIFYLLMRHIIRYNKFSIVKQMFIFPLLGFIGISFLIKVTLEQINLYSILGWSMMLALLGLLCLLAVYHSRYRTEQERADLIEVKKNITEKALNEFIVYQKECRQLSHDMRKHCTVLYDLIDKQKNEEALQYIKNMQEPLSIIESVSWTGNQIIDFILCYTDQVCKKASIQLNITADILNNISVNSKDLCSIFMNLIDNSVEACLKIEKIEQRYIVIVIRKVRQMMLIKIENSTSSSPLVLHNTLITSKENKKLHGLGIESVISTVKKYNGDFEYNFSGNTFCVNLIFYNV